MREVKGWRNERTALTRFLPTEASDYPIYSERYIAIERFVTSFLCKQDFIQPNHLTYFRVIICLCLLVFSSHLSYLEIFILAILGGLSDFLDGAYARSASKKTRLGILLDPLADKFLVFILLYILIMRKVLDPVYVLFIVIMEAHIIFIPVLSWVYGMVKQKSQGISKTSERIDNRDFILRSDPVLIGKVKVHLYAYGLLSLLLGKAIGSSILLSVGNWLLVLGITAGAVAFCTYLFRWLREPHSI